mmetsp:Transcript_19923/g.31236  ORF Transcript_19923/g.31236 Transcript_19923/m.31236 type:complete len:86 (-) Transcript_19923:153-410(-)
MNKRNNERDTKPEKRGPRDLFHLHLSVGNERDTRTIQEMAKEPQGEESDLASPNEETKVVGQQQEDKKANQNKLEKEAGKGGARA